MDITSKASQYESRLFECKTVEDIKSLFIEKKDINRNLKKWFGNSKVVDKKGNPLVVFHGTSKDFKAFQKSSNLVRKSGAFTMFKNTFTQKGHFFSSSPKTASAYTVDYDKRFKWADDLDTEMDELKKVMTNYYKTGEKEKAEDARQKWLKLSTKRKELTKHNGDYGRGSVIPVYLKIQNPLIVDGEGQNWYKVIPNIYLSLNLDNYDGLIITNIKEMNDESQTTYVVFRPKQVKSAIGNKGTYSIDSDILTEGFNYNV